MHQTKILDIKINKITTEEVLEKIKGFLLSDKNSPPDKGACLSGRQGWGVRNAEDKSQHHIITLNPEMVVEARKNDYFKKIINEASLVVADGIGILLAIKFLEKNSPLDKGACLSGRQGWGVEKITGINLIYKICEAEFIKNKKIYLLGAEEGIAEETAEVLSNKYSYLNIVGAEEGIRFEIPNTKYQIPNKIQNIKYQTANKLPITNYQLPITSNNAESAELNNKLIQKINNARPDILFVAFGAPKQEVWIYENLKKMPTVKLAIGVGGSFDFISGKTRRAPLIFQKLGLEWLWRLILEPRRIKRIYNATVKFGWLILTKKREGL